MVSIVEDLIKENVVAQPEALLPIEHKPVQFPCNQQRICPVCDKKAVGDVLALMYDFILKAIILDQFFQTHKFRKKETSSNKYR